jgi:hypothetical protein
LAASTAFAKAMKKLLLAGALAFGGCAPELVAQYPGAGGACDPLYRLQGAPAASCASDWRAGPLAHEGQAVPRPGALVQVDNETRGIADRRLPTP